MTRRALWSPEAEQAVIGGILLDNRAFEAVADILTEADFCGSSHRTLYRHVARLMESGRGADAATLIASLKAADDLDAAGGLDYVKAILIETPSSLRVAQHAAIVRDHRVERDLARAAGEMADLAHATGPVAERLSAAQQLIFGLSETSSDDEPSEIRDVLLATVEQIEERFNRGGEISGMSTGLKDLDRMIDGLHPGNLVVIGGRPSMGKSSLASGIADYLAINGKSVLVFSMEMSKQEWGLRSLSRLGRIDSMRLRAGRLNGDEWERMSGAIGILSDKKLIVDASTSLSVARMRARARRAKRKRGLDLIVIDYLQLMAESEGNNRAEQLSKITRELKLMAGELQVPVVVLSQLNRGLETRPDKRPVMSDLRESGSIEQDSDVIIFVYRHEVYHEGEDVGMAEVIVRKSRMGGTGTVRCTWIGEYTTFADHTGAYAPPEKSAKKAVAPRDVFE